VEAVPSGIVRALWVGVVSGVLIACSGASPPAGADAAGGGDAAGADAAVDDVAPAADVAPDRVRVVPTEWPREPPPWPAYSRGSCPVLRGGPTAAAGHNTAFPSGAHTRGFRLIVPDNYDPNGTDRWPLLVAWHWLAGDSAQIVREGEIERAAARHRFIAVAPDQLVADGAQVNPFTWPFLASSDRAPELTFTDDLLACVAAQYRIDPARVHGMGVSAGALWLTSLMNEPRARHFASVAILSGGLGQVSGTLRMQFTPQPNRYPAIVLWGGATDRLIVDFHAASQRLEEALLDHGHFVVRCVHDRGHSLPPLPPPPPDDSRFAFVWDFFRAHPYGLAPATSPYLDGGLPAAAPTFCGIPAVLREAAP